jgi:hypothetical protein
VRQASIRAEERKKEKATLLLMTFATLSPPFKVATASSLQSNTHIVKSQIDEWGDKTLTANRRA